MKTRTTSKTYQLGASHERQAIKAYMKRTISKMDWDNWRSLMTEAIEWIEERTKRFDAKPGGLGRKRKLNL